MVDRGELGWLAGILDGEGYLGLAEYLARRSYGRQEYRYVKAVIVIVNTDRAIIDRAASVMRAIGVVGPQVSSRHVRPTEPRWRRIHQVKTAGMADAERLLGSTVDLMTGIKQQRAVAMLAFLRSRLLHGIGCHGRRGHPYTSEQWALYETVRALSLRGTPA